MTDYVEVMFIVGDPSGDQHAAQVLARLKETNRNICCFGIGGSVMQRIGFQPILPFEPFNKMGVIEVALHLLFFLKARRRLIAEMEKRKPAVLVCVDYPGFNIQLMKDAYKRNIPVIWYIAPQVWAWKKQRASILARYASHIAVIFPFEVECFATVGGRVSYVGHPLVELLQDKQPKIPHLPSHSAKIAILPGSRIQEVEKMLPTMIEAFRLLRQKYPGITGTISRCNGLNPKYFYEYSNEPALEITTTSLINILEKSNLALVTSGTATLECALMGVPMVICYKTSTITFNILKHLITMPYIGLPNIIARQKIVPELIQEHVNAKEIVEKLQQYIEDITLFKSTSLQLLSLRSNLGNKRASYEVSKIILDHLKFILTT